MSLYIIKRKVIFLIKKIIVILISNVELLRENDKLEEDILVNLSHQQLKRPYLPNEKIDIVFIFQAASFWPSWESVWKSCSEDSRFNPIMVVSDDIFNEKVQFATARKFLRKNNIQFKHVSEINLSEINPHIVVLHTPYDRHRPRYLHGKMLSSRGYRVVYITYGIEISDTDKARHDHFNDGVTTCAWRVYTFSKSMIPFYKIYSPTGGDMVRSFGHPKFDYLNNVCFPSLPVEIKNNVKGRKVVLWKVHFPKEINGEMITPSLKLYEDFLDDIPNYDDLLFIFMPHPKFYEQLTKFSDVDKFRNKVNKRTNVIEFTDDEYRPVLINSDYYIVDRSALMIEAGVTNKPILYVSTKASEPMTAPVKKIIDSYYQASTLQEIKYFLDEVVINGHDPLQESRKDAFTAVIPIIDGKAGYYIKEDMITSVKNEVSIKNRHFIESLQKS